MKLKEIADQLQIPSQRIKDLKKKGIFTPENESTGNRPINYTDADLEQLRRIILLNKCGISSGEILDIKLGKKTLSAQIDEKRESLEEQIKKIEASLFLMLPVRANSEDLKDDLVKIIYNQAKRMEKQGTKFYEPQEYTFDGYNPYVQRVCCPTCHVAQNFDLMDFETYSGSDDCPMGHDRLFEVETEPDSLECIYCGTRFGVKGWFREYPLGAYDSSELVTFKEDINE